MKNLSSIASWLGHRPAQSRLPDIGMREMSVLEVLWQQEHMTAQSVLQKLSDSDISLSTVQSTLERLHRKELVEREKSGRAYVYLATLSRQNIISRLLHEIAENLADGDTAPMVSGFLDYLADEKDGAPLQIPKHLTDKNQ